jgi:transcriptional regulator with XRE-family HTH domain
LGGGMINYNKKLKDYRKANKLSLDILASRSGVSKSYLWEIENGKNFDGVTIGRLNKICSALGLKSSDFLADNIKDSDNEKAKALYHRYKKAKSKYQQAVNIILGDK